MDGQQADIGLGLKLNGQTHFSDLTNLVAADRHLTAGGPQSVYPHQHVQGAMKQQEQIEMVQAASGSQDTLMEHSSADRAFGHPHPDSEAIFPTATLYQPHQHHTQAESLAHAAGQQPTPPHSAGLAQAFGVDGHYQPANSSAVSHGNLAPHHHLQSPTRCSVPQDTTQSPLDLEDGQHLNRLTADQAHAEAVYLKPEASPALDSFQVNSYPCSPPSRTQALSQSGLRTLRGDDKPIGARHGHSHRSSHSLSQAAAFATSVHPHDMLRQNHFSAPASPSDGPCHGQYHGFFHHPGLRHENVLNGPEPAHLYRQGGPLVTPRASVVSTAPSVRSTSPSASLASTSMTSISPLGSSRLNPDASFTSENSFDSWSNNASGSFSRASSTSDDVFVGDPGSLGLPSSLRTGHKPKMRLRNIDRKSICDFSAANPTVKQDVIAAKFGIERSTVSKILKNKEKWLSVEPGSEASRIAKHRLVKFPAIEEHLSNWLAGLKERGEGIRDSTIRQQALRIARELGLGEDKFKASGGWIEKFRERNQIPKPPIIEPVRAPSEVAESLAEPSSSGDSMPVEGPVEATLEGSSASNIEAAGVPAGEDNQPHPTRRQSARGSKAKGTPQKRERDYDEGAQPMLAVSPLSQDMARLHFQNMGPSGTMPSPAFFRPNFHMGPPTTPQHTCPPFAIMSQGYGNVAAMSHVTTVNDEESDRKRQRAAEGTVGPQAAMGLGAAFNFRFPPTATPAALSSPAPVTLLEQAAKLIDQTAATPQKTNTRSRRTTAGSADASSRSRSRRGKGRLSNVNHTPQTPSPLSMSPADASGETSVVGLNPADAEQLTAATLESIKASRNSDNSSSSVTAEQARQSLDLVLRFLGEQPSGFLPPDHFVIFGHLRANIEQKIRDSSMDGTVVEGSTVRSPLPLQDSEMSGETILPIGGDP